MDLSKLNDKQKEAVLYTDGPLLILAGPGSGKTRVLTWKIAYLVKEGFALPSQILAITFTNKAAREMKDRVYSLIGNDVYGIQISTFHSFGLRILKENHELVGLESSFTILDESDSISVIKKILKDMNLDEKQYNAKSIKYKISSAKNELMNPDEFEKYANNEIEKIIVNVYRKYQSRLLKSNSIDFDDLLMIPITLFRKNPEVLKKYQEQFKYVFIDEYQDTNEAQYLLSKMISAKYKNICVVGDESQCLIQGTLIDTKDGKKQIESVTKKDLVLSGSGFGKTIYCKVSKVNKKEYQGKLVRIRTKKGYELMSTFNHVTFANLEVELNKYYVYLMYKKDLGYRIGQTSSLRHLNNKVVNGIQGRLNGEHADKIWIIKVCQSKAETSYYEELIAVRYGLPKIVFHAHGRRVVLSQEQIDTLFKEINTHERVEQLMNDYGLYFDYPHYYAGGIIRDKAKRKFINISFFGGKYIKTRDMYTHRIGLNNSDEKDQIELKNLGFPIRNGRLDTWRLETERITFEQIESYAEMIKSMLDGYEIIKKAHLTREKTYRYMPIGSLREGMSVVVNNNEELEEDIIIDTEIIDYNGYVYDINVDNTHNYIANNIIVHNCVYSWRGANYKNILNFEKDYPNANTILLEQNYRSTKIIINAANDVLKNNKQKKEKHLWTENDEGVKIKYLRSYDEKDECLNVINEIRRLKASGISYNDMVVLYRTNAQSQVVEKSFLESGVPYKIVGSYAYYNREEIKNLVAYLKLISNTKDDVSLRRCINVPRRGIGEKTISNLESKANIEDKSLFDVIDSGKELEFKNLIVEMKEQSENISLTELVELILDKTGIKREYEKEDNAESDARLDNLEEFKSITRNYEEKNGIISLEDFLMEISLISDKNETNNDGERVTLMTSHSVKGLEFDVVFIIGLEEGIFPHNNSLFDNNELEEERRLFYVAITRARRLLYFLNARSRMLFGNTSINMPSRFIEEVNSDYIESNIKKEEKKIVIEDKFNKEEVDYNIGDHVTHDTYGNGIVVSVDKTILTVAFSHGHGIKKLMKNHKSIKKM